ncbi:MAG: ribbon-helix-helix domain-containing protein [Myxococcota bacterium]
MTSKRAVSGVRRRRTTRSCRKLAVSVPADLVEAVESEVRAQHFPSVSAFVSDAVEEKLERDRLQEVLDEVWRERSMTKKERAWADRILQG